MKQFSLIFILFPAMAFSASPKTVAKTVEEKVYTVPQTKPEILIGNQGQLPARKQDSRAERLFFVGISKSSLTYKIPSLIPNVTGFDQSLVGLAIGRKMSHELFYYRGHFEVTGEWMRFKRTSSIFEQKVNLFQVDLIQNIDLAWTLKRKLFFSAGIGLAPMYLLGEQSVFGNSFSRFGASGILKFDFIVPVINGYEVDLGLKGQWGSAGGHELFLSSLNLGVNFE